jgi:hypothetical protein
MGGGEHGARGRFTKVRVGSRRWQGALRAAKDMVLISLPPRDSTRGSRPWRGRGGVNRSNAAAASYVRGKGPRLNLAPGIYTCACWGARWRGASGLRGDARECKRERECEHERERERNRLGAHDGQ